MGLRLQPGSEVAPQGLLGARAVRAGLNGFEQPEELPFRRVFRRVSGANGLPALGRSSRVRVDVEAPAREPRRAAPSAPLDSVPERSARASLGDHACPHSRLLRSRMREDVHRRPLGKSTSGDSTTCGNSGSDTGLIPEGQEQVPTRAALSARLIGRQPDRVSWTRTVPESPRVRTG